MVLIPVLCPRCHTDQVMKGGKTKVHICNTTGERSRSSGIGVSQWRGMLCCSVSETLPSNIAAWLRDEAAVDRYDQPHSPHVSTR